MSLVQLHLNAPSWPMSPKKLAVKPDLDLDSRDAVSIGAFAALGAVPAVNVWSNSLIGAQAGAHVAKQFSSAGVVEHLGEALGGVTGFGVGLAGSLLSMTVGLAPVGLGLSACFGGTAARVAAQAALEQRQQRLEERYLAAEQLVSEQGPIRDVHFEGDNFSVQTAKGEWLASDALDRQKQMELLAGSLLLRHSPYECSPRQTQQTIWGDGRMNVSVNDRDFSLRVVADAQGSIEGARASIPSQQPPFEVLAQWSPQGQIVALGQTFDLPVSPESFYSNQPKGSV